MKMYEVCAKCGHVGRDFYTEKIFAVKAKNAKEAAQFARFIPRVKHHHPDAMTRTSPAITYKNKEE